jgi:hypothetical protein
LNRSAVNATSALNDDSRTFDASSIPAIGVSSTRNVASAGAPVRSPVRFAGLDLEYAIAIAASLRPFVAGEVRPLVDVLIGLLKAGQAQDAPVVSLLDRLPRR